VVVSLSTLKYTGEEKILGDVIPCGKSSWAMYHSISCDDGGYDYDYDYDA
jgi:hypothetical protein